jgi:SnoaL-like domain
LRRDASAAQTSSLQRKNNHLGGDTMRKLAALVCTLGLIAAAEAATPDAALNAPIHQFIDSFNNGDGGTAAAAHVTGGVQIVDEFPPYSWQGEDAFKSWAKDFDSDATKNGITNAWVALGDTVRQETAGDHAYVVINAVYTYKLKGTPMREPAQMTFALRKEDGAWRIAAWTWTGPAPQPQ